MKNFLSKKIGNHFIHELLVANNGGDIFHEIGSIINETRLDFIIYTSSNYHETILKVAESTFEEKYLMEYFVLSEKYKLVYKINFVSKKFSQKEIERFTYYYFIPDKTNNRYIFKYAKINKNLIELLENNSFWFNSPQNFTDITDCKFVIETEPSKKNILDFYYEKYLHDLNGKKNTLDISNFEKTFKYPSKEQFNADLFEHHYNGTISKLGITCFSEKYDNKLMWDSYADGSKGVCLIFDTSVSDDKYYIFKGVKVRYFKLPPKYFFDASGRMEMGNIIFSKTNVYKYENEIRECINFQFSNTIDRNINFNPSSLSGIIFGARCTEEDKEMIKTMILKKYKNIEFIESRLDGKLNIKISNNNINLNQKKAAANIG